MLQWQARHLIAAFSRIELTQSKTQQVCQAHPFVLGAQSVPLPPAKPGALAHPDKLPTPGCLWLVGQWLDTLVSASGDRPVCLLIGHCESSLSARSRTLGMASLHWRLTMPSVQLIMHQLMHNAQWHCASAEARIRPNLQILEQSIESSTLRSITQSTTFLSYAIIIFHCFRRANCK